MKRLDIYTDGSHLDKQHNGRLGVGGVIVDLEKRKLLNSFSTELLPKYMKMTFGADRPSNPSAEMVAVLHALYNFEKEIKTADLIVIHADYIGVREWMTGKWRIKEPYIQRIKNDIDSEISRQSLKGKIQYEWVRGHQKDASVDTYWNNYVDLLAKGQEND
jgi:ribonuclease HI